MKENKKFPKWFYLVAVLLPFALLVFLELALRLFNYGENRDQWIDAGYNQLTLNSFIAKRYFRSNELALTVLSSNFDKIKKENAFRVFVIGESSAAGFPSTPNGAFSNYLNDRLKLVYPESKIEIINCGITAINSYAWLDLIPGIIEQKPDLIIIYGGHNEYYGALGVASTVNFGNTRSLVRFSLWLDNFKVTALTRNLIRKISGWFGSNEIAKSNSTMMARLSQGQMVGYQSEIFQKGIEQFEENMRDILKLTRQNEIPVILSTLVSNLKDQTPFVSEQSKEAPDANNFFNQAKRKLSEEKIREADSLFRLAKDLDLLKFRAPEAFNSIIRKLAEEFNYPIAEIDSAFAKSSSRSITGDELMTDHLHPTLSGYMLMGKEYFDVMQKNHFLPKTKSIDIAYESQDSLVKEKFKFSKLDTLIVQHRIGFLKNDWPYVKEGRMPYLPKLNSYADSLAFFIASGKTGWGNGHQTYADYLLKRDFNSYKMEMKILIDVFQNNLERYDSFTDELVKRGLYEEAFPYLKIRFEKLPDAFSSKWLGLINFFNKKNKEAIYYLEKSVKISADDPEVYYYLTGAYGKEEQFREAYKSICKCLEIAPNYPKGKSLQQFALNELRKRNLE
jgi:lysophospholipase L1-like esterase